MEGSLVKAGPQGLKTPRRRWKQRFFVLDTRLLCYYEDVTQVRGSARPLLLRSRARAKRHARGGEQGEEQRQLEPC